MARIVCVVVVIAAVLCGCGGTDKAALIGAAGDSGAPALESGLSTLPTDGVQPWESVDSRGYVIPQEVASGGARIPARDADGQEWPSHRSISAFPSSSAFAPGRERFLEGGNVSDFGEASSLVSSAGSGEISYAIYRFPMGGAQPGAVAVDANLFVSVGGLAQYWVAVSDYGNGTWQWHGPFAEAQVTLALGAGDYLSSFGNTFVAVAVFEAGSIDLIGVTVSADDSADTTAPPALASAPQLTPVASGIEAEWLPVIAGDLAGYRVYWSYSPFTAASDNGVQSIAWLENTTRIVLPATTGRMTWVGISAVDVNGNESALSPVVSAQRLSNAAPPQLSVIVTLASVQRGAPLQIIASGADFYDIDSDGDGDFDITGDTSGIANIDTSAPGIIRPRVRASSSDGTAVALGSVSLIVSGNQRPVANAQCTPQTGVAPLTVTMNGTGEDFDGAISEYAWDFDGDGIYDHNSGADGITAETYTLPGLYNAKLRVTDDQGAWDVDTVSILVTSGVHIDAVPSYAQPGQQVTLTATPPPGGLAGYEWDLDGDGSYETDTGADYSVTTSFTESGDHAVGVLVDMAAGPDATGASTVRIAGWVLRRQLNGDNFGGWVSSLGVVNGHPAIAFFDWTDLNLSYVRALDPRGEQWPAKTVLTPGADQEGEQCSLAVVDGRPAIAYRNATAAVLRFIRAADANGAAWDAPVTVDDPADSVGSYPRLLVVGGNPAVAYRNDTDIDAVFVRATNAQGTAWGPPVQLTSVNNDGYHINMEIVNGNPAVSYYDATANRLGYCRATDALGSGWGPRVNIGPGAANTNNKGMAIVDGFPAIAYGDTGAARTWFLRALDADGTNWPSFAQLIHPTGTAAGCGTTLAVVNGVPVVLHGSNSPGNSTLLSRAANAQGSAWHPPQVVFQHSGVYSNSFTSIADMGGQVGVSFHQISDGMGFGLLY